MKLLKYICNISLIIILCGCSYSNKTVNQHIHNKLYGFFNKQFEENEYTSVFLNNGYYSVGQASHYILINKLLGNEVSQDSLNLFKTEVIKSNYLNIYSIDEILIDYNLLNEDESKKLRNEFIEFISKNSMPTDNNWFDLYYSALNLNKMDGYNVKEIAEKMEKYFSSIKDEKEKLQAIYCYCSLMKTIDDFSYKDNTEIKKVLQYLSRNEEMKSNLNLEYVYYAVLNMLDITEFKDENFLDLIEKEGLYDTYDNLNLDRLYIKMAILNEAKPNVLNNHKDYILGFLNSFRDEKSKILFPILSVGKAEEYDYYAYKLVMENFLCEKGIKVDTKFEEKRLLDYNQIDSMRGKLYRLIYDKFVADGINEDFRMKLADEIKSKSKKELLDNYLALVVWRLIGNDINKLIDKKELFAQMKTDIIDKNYSLALEKIDLLNMMGVSKKSLIPHFDEVFNVMINSDKLMDDEIYLNYLLRYELKGIKPTETEINKKFDIRYSPDNILIVTNGDRTRFIDIKDYLYYFSLKNIDNNIIVNYVR